MTSSFLGQTEFEVPKGNRDGDTQQAAGWLRMELRRKGRARNISLEATDL